MFWDFTMIIDYHMDGEKSLQELVLGGARTLNDVVMKPGGTKVSLVGYGKRPSESMRK